MRIGRAPPSLKLIIATAATTKTVAASSRFRMSFLHFYNFHNKKKNTLFLLYSGFSDSAVFIFFQVLSRKLFSKQFCCFLCIVSLLLLQFLDTVIDGFLKEPIANTPQYQITDSKGKVCYKHEYYCEHPSPLQQLLLLDFVRHFLFYYLSGRFVRIFHRRYLPVYGAVFIRHHGNVIFLSFELKFEHIERERNP